MATRSQPKTGPMCMVRIDYRAYLLPADKGMKLVELLQAAFNVDEDFASTRNTYTVGAQPDISLTLVRPDQIRMPQGTSEPFPLPTQRRLLK